MAISGFAITSGLELRAVLAGLLVAALIGSAHAGNVATIARAPSRMTHVQHSGSEDAYRACVNAEATVSAISPASADDVALAAQVRCWSYREAYRALTEFDISRKPQTRAELQFAVDRGHALVRQLDFETRRSALRRIVAARLENPPEVPRLAADR